MHLRPTLYTAALALLLIGRASGAELCVKCTGPEASYACVVNTSAAGTIDTVIKVYCITALAKIGPHESCAIDRGSTPPCQGERRVLPVPSQLEQALDDPDVTPPAPPAAGETAPHPSASDSAPAGDHAPAETAKDKPPKTVEEMVEKSAQSAGDGISQTQKSANTALEKAGSAVGNAAKSSWKCLSSFFTNC